MISSSNRGFIIYILWVISTARSLFPWSKSSSQIFSIISLFAKYFPSSHSWCISYSVCSDGCEILNSYMNSQYSKPQMPRNYMVIQKKRLTRNSIHSLQYIYASISIYYIVSEAPFLILHNHNSNMFTIDHQILSTKQQSPDLVSSQIQITAVPS